MTLFTINGHKVAFKHDENIYTLTLKHVFIYNNGLKGKVNTLYFMGDKT